MKAVLAPVVLLAAAAFGQDYLIRTHAGPGTVAENVPATSTYIRTVFSIAADSSGAIYYGEVGSFVGRVRRIGVDGRVVTLAGTEDVRDAVPFSPAVPAYATAVDASGRVYFGGDGVIFRIDANGLGSLFAGALGQYTDTGDGGPASAASIAGPYALAFDTLGNLYLTSRCRVRKISTTGIITTVAGNHEGPEYWCPDPPQEAPALSSPLGHAQGLAIAPDGTIYISDAYGHRIRKVTTNGIASTVLEDPRITRGEPALAFDKAGALLVSTSTGIARVTPAGLVPIAGSNSPARFTVEKAGNILAAEEDVIVRITPAGERTILAGGNWYDGKRARQAALIDPKQIARDAVGNLYFMDGSRVRQIDPTGIVTTVAGGHFRGFSGDGAAATAAAIDPSAIAVDRAGNLFIAGANRIRRVDKATGIIETIAGSGQPGWSGVGGPAKFASIAPDSSGYPVQVAAMAVDAHGQVHFAVDDRIARVNSAGILQLVAGGGVQTRVAAGGYVTSVRATSMLFDDQGRLVFSIWYPTGVIRRINSEGVIETLLEDSAGISGLASDSRGNLYYSFLGSNGNENGVAKVHPGNQVQRIAGGSWTYRSNEDTHTALDAGFNFSPESNLVSDETGTLYLADTFNYRIRRIFPDPCAFFSATSRYIGAAGGVFAIDVTARGTCVWSATPDHPWLKIVSATGMTTGPASLSITVEPNRTGAPRTGSVSIAGQRLQIQQPAADCAAAVTPIRTSDVPALGAVIQFRVAATASTCAWSAGSEQSWAEVYPISGSGAADVTVRVYPTFSAVARAATVFIAGQRIDIRQAASAEPFNYRLIRQLYFSFFGRQPSQAELDFQVTQALNRGVAPSKLFENFMGSEEFNRGGRYVAGLYVGFLDRDPEYGGWLFQRNALATGLVTPEQLAVNFLGSSEFQQRYGNLSDADFVKLLYRQVLLREASAAEVAFQAAALRTIPRVQMARSFLDSAEFRNGTGPRLTAFLSYALALMRDPTPSERSLLIDMIREGQSVSAIADALIGNQESHMTVW